MLVVLPVGVTLLYLFALLAPVGLNQSSLESQGYELAEKQKGTFRVTPLFFQHMSIDAPQERDQQYWKEVSMGTAYVAASTLTFTYALLAARVFRHSLLGAPWGLLLLGIGLNWVADMHYYYSSIYYFDRTNPVHGIWLASTMIICYALYKHREL